ncbi:MAG TPA: lysozyme inhibitor LprI family protein [Acidiphilium sp.]
MRNRVSFLIALSWLALIPALFVSSSAWAIDCAHAVKPIEKRICASPSLRSADAAMGKAYIAALAAAPDPELRAVLVRSQRRWIAARNDGLVTDFDNVPLPVSTLRDAFLDRATVLEDRSRTGLITEAEAERHFLAKYAKAPYTGIATDCFFAPDTPGSKIYTYVCTGSLHVQNGNRVCSIDREWATWRLYTYYGVSTVADGKTTPAAFCNGRQGDCTGTGSDESGWVAGAATAGDNFPTPATGLPRLDAEGIWPLSDGDIAWFKTCLTSPA